MHDNANYSLCLALGEQEAHLLEGGGPGPELCEHLHYYHHHHHHFSVTYFWLIIRDLTLGVVGAGLLTLRHAGEGEGLQSWVNIL